MQHPRSASVSLDARLSSRAGTQADEGSTAACDYPCAVFTFRYLRGSTCATNAGRKRRTMLRLRLECQVLKKTRTPGNLIFVNQVKPVQNRQ